MTCPTPNEEWTIRVITDGDTSNPPAADVIVFCLAVENGKIKGAVSLSSGAFLSSVTGTVQPIMDAGPNGPSSLMTLIFTWGKTNVVLSGFILPGTPRSFRGSWAAFESAPLVSMFASVTKTADHPVLPTAPADGDTGTGTGTQT